MLRSSIRPLAVALAALWSCLAIGPVALGPVALGQDQPTSDLATKIAAAQGGFQAAKPEELAASRTELATAVRDLEAWLIRSGASKAEGWKKYLRWSDLENIVAQEPPPPAAVATVLDKLTGNATGLENRRMVRVRKAIEQYAKLASAAADPKVQESYAKSLDALMQHVAAYQQNPAAGDDAIAITRALDWLARHGQATSVQTAVRDQFAQPNLYASVSKRFAAAGMEQDVDQVTGVRENILGTDLHGTARMTGRTTLSLLENPHAATFNILLGGTAVSRNIGYNGPVTVHTTGITSISGSKQLQMTADGLVGYRASANARTNSTIHDICARCGLIEKVAWRRAGEQKAEAQAIASGRAAARVAAQMDREAGGLIAEQNANYREKFVQPLQKRNAFPQVMNFSTTTDRAAVQMLQAGTAGLGAPGAPPEHAGENDIAVRAHESLVVNFGQVALGGEELTDLRLEKLIRDDLKAELPEELRITLPDGTLDPDKEPWSIIFAKELPVRARFQDGGLWIALRADGFTRGEGDEPGTYKPAITELVEIAAAYKIERTDAGATLRRDGDVQIRFPNRENPDQIGLRDNATVTFMRRKFRSLFKEEFVGEGLKFKGRWADAGVARLQELNSDKAWLTLGWNLEQPAAAAAGAE